MGLTLSTSKGARIGTAQGLCCATSSTAAGAGAAGSAAELTLHRGWAARAGQGQHTGWLGLVVQGAGATQRLCWLHRGIVCTEAWGVAQGLVVVGYTEATTGGCVGGYWVLGLGCCKGIMGAREKHLEIISNVAIGMTGGDESCCGRNLGVSNQQSVLLLNSVLDIGRPAQDEQTLPAEARPLQTPPAWRSDQCEQAKSNLSGEGAAFYRWRESRVRRSRRNFRAAKFGRRSRGCRRRIRRIPYGGGVVNVGVQKETESHINLIHRDPPIPEGNPSVATCPPVERETNIMTQDELDRLRESYSFPPSIQIKLPEEDETTTSIHLGEVAFYEAAFHIDLRLLLYPIIRRILYIYNICPAQLDPNAWQSLIYAVVVWRAHKFFLSLTEFRNDWEFPPEISGDVCVPRVPRSWGTLGKQCNKPHVLSTIEQESLDGILDSLSGGIFFTIKEVLESKSFRRCFKLGSKLMASIGGDNGEDI
ncbi:hypothetical protein Acr_29g0010620 [Actinidia rufa]|uniref:Uncharacterized protein n=1 Tax=Actinidia rufa TaxID=165716 RepID=A0A7J0HFJ2_9ERIC|nr:hypothetical protein Acr_29g0010620 [Actinidia rufa]